jgi:hypothetical protein
VSSPLQKTATAFAIYLAVAVALLYPLVFQISTHILADDVFIRPGQSDAYNFLWSYWWIQKAVLHGFNLYQCQWVYPPSGANLFFHTHVILPTLLTLPFGLLLGATAGYNIMIILMLSGAACIYEAFVRYTFQWSRITSLIAGGLFGFCPYFVFKTHAHVNLIGGVFWGGCLAVLLYAYLRDQFSWRTGLLFSLGLWATFWTSFVEFFALLVVCAAAAIVLELERALARRPFDATRRASFFAMTLPGLISFTALVNSPRLETIEIGVFPRVLLRDVLAPPRLSLFGGTIQASAFEYWGSHIPIVYVALAIAGLVAVIRKPSMRTQLAAVGVIALLTLLTTLNPGEVPIQLLRELPTGAGFRVVARFLPFCFFFLLVFTAYGLEQLLRIQARSARFALLGVFALVTFVELYPWQLEPSAVKRFVPPKELIADGERGVFTLIIPRTHYFNVLDTYQVSLNVPVLNLSFLAREAPEARAMRALAFPSLYPFPRKLTRTVREQMDAAHVRYVLYEDERQYVRSKSGGTPIAAQNGAILVRY